METIRSLSGLNLTHDSDLSIECIIKIRKILLFQRETKLHCLFLKRKTQLKMFQVKHDNSHQINEQSLL